MPNFRIRRRRKPDPEPTPAAPPQEEKIDDTEEMISESEDEAYIDKAMSDLKLSNLSRENPVPQKPTPVVNQPHYPPQRVPQYQKPTNVVYQNPKPASYRNQYPTHNRIPTQYTRKPTMEIANPRSKNRRGGTKIRYNTHYGAGGEHLDTRTKSIMLYNHCFG